jgi:hypothetical protein
MRQFKAILLNQYIGAIAIGYIAGRGVEAILSAIMPTMNVMLTETLSNRRVVEDLWSTARLSLVSNLILGGMYFFVAYLLGLWLYSKPEESASSGPDINEGS